jgi:hypothetical protein
MNCINLYAVVLSEVMSRMERPEEHATVFTAASVLIIVIMLWFVWYFDIIACGWLVEHFFAPIQACALRLLHATAVKLGLRSEVAGPAGRDTLPDPVETLSPAPPSIAALPPRPKITVAGETLPTQAQLDSALGREETDFWDFCVGETLPTPAQLDSALSREETDFRVADPMDPDFTVLMWL